jgi:hypothetical protein
LGKRGSFFEDGGSFFEDGGSFFEMGGSFFEMGGSFFEMGGSFFEMGGSFFEDASSFVTFSCLRLHGSSSDAPLGVRDAMRRASAADARVLRGGWFVTCGARLRCMVRAGF